MAATRLFEGVEVTEYRHVTGWGGGRALLASWSDPWNASANRLCTLAPNAPSSERCPRQCSAQPRHLRSRRLRKAIGKMSDREWRKVVDALWVMRTVSDAEGRERYGPQYRGMDYHLIRHLAASVPGPDVPPGARLGSWQNGCSPSTTCTRQPP